MAEANDLNVEEVKAKGMSIEWNIKNFSSMPRKTGQSLKRSFCLGNETWEVTLYPKGLFYPFNVEVGVFCKTMRIRPQWIWTSALLIIEENLVAECTGYIGDEDGDNGYMALISEQKLLGCLSVSRNKTVKLKCLFCNMQSCNGKLSVAAQTDTTISGSIDVLSDDIQNLYNNNELCDVKIIVGRNRKKVGVGRKSKKFLAHRAILAARSPVFSSMFKHELTEKVDGVIDITDFDPESFEDFLKFLYSGKFGDNETNYRNLYKIADKYCVNYLKRLCVDRMSETLEVETIFDVFDLASVHNETRLLKNATTFFIKKAEYIIGTEQWNKFVVEKTSLSSKILKKLVKKAQLIDD